MYLSASWTLLESLYIFKFFEIRNFSWRWLLNFVECMSKCSFAMFTRLNLENALKGEEWLKQVGTCLLLHKCKAITVFKYSHASLYTWWLTRITQFDRKSTLGWGQYSNRNFLYLSFTDLFTLVTSLCQGRFSSN